MTYRDSLTSEGVFYSCSYVLMHLRTHASALQKEGLHHSPRLLAIHLYSPLVLHLAGFPLEGGGYIYSPPSPSPETLCSPLRIVTLKNLKSLLWAPYPPPPPPPPPPHTQLSLLYLSPHLAGPHFVRDPLFSSLSG